MTSGSNVTNACIHSEACMVDLTWALVRMPPLKLFGVDLFLSEKQKSPWVEWLQCSCSLMCSCSDKHRVLSHDRWLSNRVLAKEYHRVMHILPECVHSAELYWGAIDFLKNRTRVVAWVVLLSSIVSSYCHYCQLQPVQTHKWKCLMVILPQLYHCWQ